MTGLYIDPSGSFGFIKAKTIGRRVEIMTLNDVIQCC